MKHYIPAIFLILILFPFLVYSQKGYIQGVVTDADSHNKISYASITLNELKDTAVVKGVMSNLDGSFEIMNINEGNYLVKVYLTGYEKWISNPIVITKENLKINLSEIALKISPLSLNAAQVVAVKPLFEEKHGTLSMNVDANPTATGDNVLELLKKMPSVVVDQNDNITVEGKSGITILIDDKPTYLSGDDLIALLKSISSSTVEKIEVIKKPSARYDAQGAAGIINIVSKRNQNLGINGSVYAGIGITRNLKHNEGFNLTARIKKIVISANYSLYSQKSSNSSRSENSSVIAGDTILITSNEMDNELWKNVSRWQGHNFKIGADYFINKKNVISLTYRGNISKSDYEENNFSRIYKNSQLDSSYSRIANYLGISFNHTINLNYKHSFDSTGKDLFLDFTYSNNIRKSFNESNLKYYFGDFESEYRYDLMENETDPSTTEVFSFKADYEHPIDDNIKYEAGIKSALIFNNIANKSYLNNQFRENNVNDFRYKENINAAYILLSITTEKKVDIQVGLRGEYTYLSGLQITTGEAHSQSYFDLFPTFNLGYHFPKNHNLDFSYRYRISRPDYYSLNPFVTISDAYSRSSGNPYLKPQYAHNLNLNYSWNYIISTWIGYTYSLDEYTYMEHTDPVTNIRTSLPENIGKSKMWNAGLSARYTVGKWWTMNYYLGMNYGHQFFDYENQKVKKQVYSAWLYANETFTFLKNYSIEISAYGSPSSESTFGKTKGRIFVNAGIKANFLKNTLTAKVSINDIFNNGYWQERNIYPSGNSSYEDYRWESRQVWITLSYRFGKQNIQTRQMKSRDNDELDRMGGGNDKGGEK